jgi:hypothetical protein
VGGPVTARGLSGGAEITYHGRRCYHLRVTRGDGALSEGAGLFRRPADIRERRLFVAVYGQLSPRSKYGLARSCS